jgi:hypothetical protein
LLGAVRAQAPPPPAPTPGTTAVPGEAPRTSFLPTADLRVFTNGNTNVVGDGESAVGASVGLVLPVTWIRPLSTWGLHYSTGGQAYGRDDRANDFQHHFSGSYNRRISERSSFGFNLAGNKSEQQSFNAENPDFIDRAITLAPRTDVLHLGGGAHANFTTGRRSYLDFSVRGALSRYDDIAAGALDPEPDPDQPPPTTPSAPVSFVDSVSYGGSVSWGMSVSERTTAGLGYAYGRITYDETGVTEDRNGDGDLDTEDLNDNEVLDPGEDLNGNGLLDREDLNGNDLIDVDFPARDTTVHSAFFNGTRRLSEFTTGSLSLGVLVGQQEGSEDRVEPSIRASLSRQITEQSALSFGLRQSAGMGIGNGIATLDRGLYGTWSWGRPTVSASVGLAYWNRETLIDPLGGQDQTTSTFQVSESLGWTPGPRFTYGVFHSFRDQVSDDPTFDSEGYNSGGVFVRWNIRGRSARG